MNQNLPHGPSYPLVNAYTRFFSGMTEAIQHYLQYQYVRCQLWAQPDGRVLMVVHA